MRETKTTADAIMDELKRDLAEWMEAKEDLVWRPPIDIRTENDDFVAQALVPGFDAEKIEILISPTMLLVKGQTDHGELSHRRLMRSVRFPEPIDVDSVHGQIRNGMLTIRAHIARAANTCTFMPKAA